MHDDSILSYRSRLLRQPTTWPWRFLLLVGVFAGLCAIKVALHGGTGSDYVTFLAGLCALALCVRTLIAIGRQERSEGWVVYLSALLSPMVLALLAMVLY